MLFITKCWNALDIIGQIIVVVIGLLWLINICLLWKHYFWMGREQRTLGYLRKSFENTEDKTMLELYAISSEISPCLVSKCVDTAFEMYEKHANISTQTFTQIASLRHGKYSYFLNTSITAFMFLGLLGTFYGLATSLVNLGTYVETVDRVRFASQIKDILSKMDVAFFTTIVAIVAIILIIFLRVLIQRVYWAFHHDLERFAREVIIPLASPKEIGKALRETFHKLSETVANLRKSSRTIKDTSSGIESTLNDFNQVTERLNERIGGLLSRQELTGELIGWFKENQTEIRSYQEGYHERADQFMAKVEDEIGKLNSSFQTNISQYYQDTKKVIMNDLGEKFKGEMDKFNTTWEQRLNHLNDMWKENINKFYGNVKNVITEDLGQKILGARSQNSSSEVLDAFVHNIKTLNQELIGVLDDMKSETTKKAPNGTYVRGKKKVSKSKRWGTLSALKNFFLRTKSAENISLSGDEEHTRK